jgi:bifunctional non-homologous end joining protein LigD
MRAKAKRALPAAVALPDTLAPELATLVAAPPASLTDWIFEVKFDGYRMLARVDGAVVRILSRNGLDWTAKLKGLQEEIARSGLPDGWYDGEIVVLDASGRPNFGLLQNAFDRFSIDKIIFYVFDAPFMAGEDLRELALTERRDRLRAAMRSVGTDLIRFSEQLDAPPAEMMAAACQLGLEGLIGKRKDSRYVHRRSPDWIKLKCGLRQEFVVGGYTEPSGARPGIGSLLLGVYDEKGALVYCGSVGTGFDDKTLRMLLKRLRPLKSSISPFAPSRELEKKANWVEPNLVVEVAFADWTSSGSVRHATFRGVRADKLPTAVVRETDAGSVATKGRSRSRSAQLAATPSASLPAPMPSIKVTNGDRVIDQVSGVTKQTIVAYYGAAADVMLPHLKDRPTSLVRAPAGVSGDLFFQKHAESAQLASLMRYPTTINPGHQPMLSIPSKKGLLATAQWNVIEFHTQNALGARYETPSRMLFDLDPGEGVSWSDIQEAAQLVRGMIEHLGLHPFLKTSGGKGLHVDVPIEPQFGWAVVKDLSKAIVAHMSKQLPDRFVVKSGPSNRAGRIFIDYLRNGRGATTACAWSARARPGLGISVPVGWDELADLTSGAHWTILNISDRLVVGNDPWTLYWSSAGSIGEALEMLEVKRPRIR